MPVTCAAPGLPKRRRLRQRTHGRTSRSWHGGSPSLILAAVAPRRFPGWETSENPLRPLVATCRTACHARCPYRSCGLGKLLIARPALRRGQAGEFRGRGQSRSRGRPMQWAAAGTHGRVPRAGEPETPATARRRASPTNRCVPSAAARQREGDVVALSGTGGNARPGSAPGVSRRGGSSSSVRASSSRSRGISDDARERLRLATRDLQLTVGRAAFLHHAVRRASRQLPITDREGPHNQTEEPSYG
jgi:hypothetical protein